VHLALNITSLIARIGLCACLLVILPANAKRLALVMGNDNYTSVTKLQKAGNDATAMARELKAAGFTVQLHKDLNYRGMVKAVETFTNSITGGDEVVVFYAGHGVQIKTGSYLLPIDIEASSESEVEKTAYELNALTDKISEAKPAFSLVMVDACRDNPLKAKGRSVGGTRGLSAFEPPKGQIVVYSASRGQQALDSLSAKDTNPNGVFTREFMAGMKKPGVKIEDLMREVQDSVEILAKSVNHDQRPAIYNEARGNFYFFGPTTVQTAANSAPPMSAEQKDEKFWEDVKLAGNKEAFEAYLQRYPEGIYANLAKAITLKLTDANKTTSALSTNAQNNLFGDAETQQVYLKAKEQNDGSALNNLGVRYQLGTGGLAKDDVQAEKYYRLSANQGNALGQYNLGAFYANGQGGLAKDYIQAEKYYRLSANQGNALGQNNLGVFYANGQGGLAKDDVQAEKYYRLSANQGNALGQANLGYFYIAGLGSLEKDDFQAKKYFWLSANQGNATAQENIGTMYRDGRGGLVKDEAEAIRFYKLSAKQNYQPAIDQLRKLGATF
jgi:TPR repeat protein